MKILLINNDSMVTKLFEATAKKLGLELVVQDNLNPYATEEELFLFVNDDIEGDFLDFIQNLKPIFSCYLYKRSGVQAQGFDSYIKKPFLPTEILDIIKPRLGESEATESNITKNDLEDLSSFDPDSFDDIEGLDIEAAPSNKAVCETIVSESDSDIEEYNLDDFGDLKDDLKELGQKLELETLEDDKDKLTQEMDFDLKDFSDTIEEVDNSVFEAPSIEEVLSEPEASNQEEQEAKQVEEQEVEEQVEDNLAPEVLEDKEEQKSLDDEVEELIVKPEEEISSQSNVLDKEQIDEVKKILEETNNKDVSMEEIDEIENFENINEDDIINALEEDQTDDMPSPKKKPKSKSVSHKKDKPLKQKSANNSNQSDEDKHSSVSSNNSSLQQEIFNLIENTSIESLKELLDGMQLTINISFSNKKK